MSLRESNFKSTLIALALGLLAALLAGCAPLSGGVLIRPAQPAVGDLLPIAPGDRLGQTFTARHDGLQAVEVFLKGLPAVEGEVPGSLVLELLAAPGDPAALAESTLPLEAVAGAGFYRFSFPALADSGGRDYYLALEVQGDGRVNAGLGAPHTYLDGALYLQDEPREAQLAFRLGYAPAPLLLGLAADGLRWLFYLAAGGLLFVLPGWGLLALALRGTPAGEREPQPGFFHLAWQDLNLGERLGLSIGASLAVYPLLFLWSDLVGLRLGPLYAFLPPALGLALLMLAARRARRDPRPARGHPANPARRDHPADLVLLAVLALAAMARFWAVRNLEAPMWGDSLQHTMIAQLLVDHGGLFDSWEPYAPLVTFTYHFGFHTQIAAFHWITGLALPEALLWGGQVLNLLAVLAVYPLASRLGGSRWAGATAVLIAGLLLSMPMIYVNWGRYTQLAGQAILPAALLLAGASFRRPKAGWKAAAMAALALGGLALTHYRVLVFAVLFYAVLFLFALFERDRLARLEGALLSALGGAVLFLPWFVQVFAGRILSALGKYLSTPAGQAPEHTQTANAIGSLLNYLPIWAWALAGLALLWGLARRSRGAAILGLWAGLALLAANPQWLNLPGEGTLGSFTVLIAAYIPAAALIGAAAAWLLDLPLWAERPALRNALAAGLAALILAAGLWGAGQRALEAYPHVYALFTRPDRRAAAWIDRRLPQNARFLVNSFFAFGDTVVVGSDGGWWLPLIPGRGTTLPPLNYIFEAAAEPDYRQEVFRLTETLREQGMPSEAVIDLMRERGVKYVYVGQQQGRVNYDGPYVLDPASIAADPRFETIYHQDRVWIFQLKE